MIWWGVNFLFGQKPVTSKIISFPDVKSGFYTYEWNWYDNNLYV